MLGPEKWRAFDIEIAMLFGVAHLREGHAGELFDFGAAKPPPKAQWIAVHINEPQVREQARHVGGVEMSAAGELSLWRQAKPVLVKLLYVTVSLIRYVFVNFGSP